MRVLLAAAAAVLAVAAPAEAAVRDCGRVLADLQGELICPTCQTTLDQSSSPVAAQMRQVILERCEAGASDEQIKDELVADFGESVLAAPPRRGFNLLAWVLPLVGLGAGALAASILVWRWSRTRESAAEPAAAPEQNGRVRLEPELERRLDEELARFE